MAEQAKFENKIKSVSYSEDPLRFFQGAYLEADDVNDKQRERIKTARLFFDGHDAMLDKRKKDPVVERSALFVPEARTAIDTRYTAVTDRIEGDAMPVRLVPVNDEETPELDPENIRRKEKELNDILFQSGYLFKVFEQQFYGAEIHPVSIVKIRKDERKKLVPVKKQFDMRTAVRYMLKYYKAPPEFYIKWEYQTVFSGIIVEWLDHDEILYDPHASKIEDIQYFIHRKWVNWNELVNQARESGWDMKKVQEAKDKYDGESNKDMIFEEIADAEDRERLFGYKDGKYLICEFWFKNYSDVSERIEYRLMNVIGNSVIARDGMSPYPGLQFPFYIKVAWPKLGQIEGDSSVELTMTAQRIYNDSLNCILDNASYGGFSQLWVPKNFYAEGSIRIAPGAINQCSEPDKIKEIRADTSAIQFLLLLNQMASAKIRQLINAPDTEQGISDNNDQEKATKTRARIMGSAKRLRRCFRDAVNDIVWVAESTIAILQQDDPSWIIPVKPEVPILAGVYTPDEEFNQAANIWGLATNNNPLYSSPEGLMKLRNIFEDVLQKARLKDIDSRLLTEQELGQIIMKEVEQAQIQQQQNQVMNLQKQIGSNNNQIKESANVA